jgi:hypothetical protein
MANKADLQELEQKLFAYERAPDDSDPVYRLMFAVFYAQGRIEPSFASYTAILEHAICDYGPSLFSLMLTSGLKDTLLSSAFF